MDGVLEYKGYISKVQYSLEDKILFGKIEGINDLINFECDDVKKVEDAFHEAVDDYLSFCEEVGKDPDKAYKGTFNVRISPMLHKKAAQKAFAEGLSLNQIIEKAVDFYVNQRIVAADEVSKMFMGMNDIIKNISNNKSFKQIKTPNNCYNGGIDFSKDVNEMWTN